jgi:Ca2+-binding RTX toxin-like protein
LAFTTIPGASATDATSFIGTEGNDILTTFSTLTGYVDGLAGNDTVTLFNTAGLIDWTIRGLDGNDAITADSDLVSGLLNGNAGIDTIALEGVFGGARVLGGQDNDNIVTGSVSGSSVNGNKGDDNITVNGSVSGGTVYGGQGQDTITVNAGAGSLTNGMIDGNLGGAVIDVNAAAAATITNFEVVGGQLADLIDASGVAGGAGMAIPPKAVEGFTIKGLEGDDVIIGTGRDDTIEGGLGADNINGFFGADRMTGGAGADTFRFTGLQTWVGSIDGTGKVTVSDTDEIVDWGKGIGATGQASNFVAVQDITQAIITGGGFLTASATAYKNGSDAVNGEAVAAGTAVVVAIGEAGAYSSYLLVNDGAVKLGGGVYATVADATDINVAGGAVIAESNFIAF